MKRSYVLIFALVAAVSVPMSAHAQIFDGTPYDVEFLQFTAGSGQNGGYGFQVGPYEGRFLGNGTTDRSVTTLPFALYCVDYEHFASNSNGLVNVAGVGGDLSTTRLNDFASYQKSAYLASMFDAWGEHKAALDGAYAGTFTKSNVWGGLHAAIWDVSTGPAGLGTGQTAVARDYFLGLAAANGDDFDTSGWYVLSEADVGLDRTNSGQEFLMRSVSVPEPSSLLLMITGLVMLVGVSARRRPLLDGV